MEFFSHSDAFSAGFLLEEPDFPFPVELASSLHMPFNSFYDLRAHRGRFWALISWESADQSQPIETVEEFVASFPTEQLATAFMNDEQERLAKLAQKVEDAGSFADQSIVVGCEALSEYAPNVFHVFYSVRKSIAVIRLTAIINIQDSPNGPSIQLVDTLVAKAVEKLDNGVLLRV